jgi:Family of unknown function (DUF5995)
MPFVPLPEGIKEATYPEPKDVPGVLERLKEIQHVFCQDPLEAAEEPTGQPSDLEAALSDLEKIHDGVACFNHLYKVITAEINNRINEGNFFHNNKFLINFDVVFAKRYLEAIRKYAVPATAGATPRCWRILFENRKNQKIQPLQFAMLGVACHVCVDLPVAVVEVCKDMNRSLDIDTHCDFLKVNEIFYEKIPHLRHHYETKSERNFDRKMVRHYANNVCDFAVREGRDLAWKSAEELWKVWEPAGNSRLKCAENGLDRVTAIIGRAILGRL